MFYKIQRVFLTYQHATSDLHILLSLPQTNYSIFVVPFWNERKPKRKDWTFWTT